MKRPLLLLLALLLIPLALAAPQPDITIDAPSTAIPGETVQVAVSTQIGGVQVISIPTAVQVERPDGSTTQLDVQATGDGRYVADLYAPLRGEYALTATVSVADTDHTAQETITVQKPRLNASIAVNETHVVISGDQQRTYEVSVVDATAGALADQEPQAVCSITCKNCAEACPVSDGVAWIHVPGSFTYDLVRTAKELPSRTVDPHAAINTSDALLIDGDALKALPPTTIITEDTALLRTTNGTPMTERIRVLTADAPTVPATTAYSVSDGSWYATATANGVVAPDVNGTITAATSLESGAPLSHTATTVDAQGAFEARLATNQPAPALPRINRTAYGTRITGEYETALRLSAQTGATYKLRAGYRTDARITRHPTGTYYAQQDHAAINARAEPLFAGANTSTYTPVTQGEPLTIRLANQTARISVLDTTLERVATRIVPTDADTIEYAPTLAPGKYFLLREGAERAVSPIQVISPQQRILTDEPKRIRVAPNTQADYERSLTNADSEPRTIDIETTSPYSTTFADENGNRLTDTNLNGLPDTGLLAPGETVRVTATLYVSGNARSANATWTLTTESSEVSVADEIIVSQQESFVDEDVAVTALRETPRGAQAVLYNYDDEPHTVTYAVITNTTRGYDETQRSAQLGPGQTNVSLPLPGDALWTQLVIRNEDADRSNNERTLIHGSQEGMHVRVSEQRGRARTDYRVKASVPAGEWRVVYPDGTGGFSEAAIAQLPDSDGIVFELPLVANTDLVATIQQGTPAETFTPYTVIDNRDDRVRTVGQWVSSSQVPGYHGADYLHDLDSGKGEKRVEYRPGSRRSYEVEAWHPADRLFASNARLRFGSETITLDQTGPAHWKYVGRYELGPDRPAVVSNTATDGFVVADALRLLGFEQYATVSKEPATAPQEQPPAAAPGHLLYDSAGREVFASVSLREDGRVRRAGLLPDQARGHKGLYEVAFSFADGPVEEIVVDEADPSSMRIGVEDVPASRARQFTNRRVTDAFAINPGFNSTYRFTKVATGKELLKCTDYDFSAQECMGGFVTVRNLEPGERYTASFTPEDPVFVEVDDENIPPVAATCVVGGNYSPTNCLGTYDDDPQPSNEYVWEDENATSPYQENWTVNKDTITGIIGNYSDVERDPVEQCDVVRDVIVEYQIWETGNLSMEYDLYVDADADGWDNIVTDGAVPDTESGVSTQNVTASLSGAETWDCADFFGDNASARIRLEAERTGGAPQDDYTLHVDYLVYRIDYNFTQQPLETDKNTYVQGETVTFTGDDIWDNNANLSINVTKDGSFVDQVNATTNGSGQFNTTWTVPDYEELGLHDAYAWQHNDSTLNATTNFTVNKRSPTISTQRTGDFFNRSETVVFSGERWVKNGNVTVNATNPEGEPVPLTPTSNLTDASGHFTYHWTVPSNIDTLLGPYTFDFVEDANASYNNTKTVQVVVLPSTADDIDGQDEKNDVYKKDSTYAEFVDDNGGLEWMNATYPDTLPSSGVALSNLTLRFFHVEGSAALDHRVQWFNLSTGAWTDVCTYAPTTTAQWDTCELTRYVNQSDYMNNVSVRFTDGGSDAWPSTPEFRYDIAYLFVNFTFPPPVVKLMSPANNTWFSTAAQTLQYNATDQYFGIDECRVYVNGALEYTNTSFVVNTSDTYTHAFAEGNNSWYAACDDNSSRSLTGTSQTRQVLIDLTDPVVNITRPATNYTWFSTSTPTINFTLTDNLDPMLNWTVYVNGTQDGTGNVSNNTEYAYTLTSHADGLWNVTVEAYDSAGRYANNKSVQLYIDTTAPSVTPNDPPEGYNTSLVNVTFNWTPTDNLDSLLACEIYIDGTLNQSGLDTASGQSNTTRVDDFDDGNHDWRVTCTDEAGNTNSTATRNFTVDTAPPTVNLEAPADGTTYTATRDVTLDYNTTDALLPVDTCTLYLNDAQNQTNTTITEGVTQSFSLSDLDLGTYTWNVACNDTVGNVQNSTQWTFHVNVSAQAVSPANDTVVDRDSYNADPDTLSLVANLTDGASGVAVDFNANRTAPTVQNDILLGSNTSNASGQATLNYDPDTTVAAGNYTWWPNASRYRNDTPRTYLVYGTPQINFTHSSLDPNVEYNASQTVTLNGTVRTSPENGSELNTSYGMYLNATITASDGTTYYEKLTGVENLSGAFTIPSTPAIGVWNVTLNSSASYFYDNTTDGVITRNFTVRGAANAQSPADGTIVDRDSVSPDSDTITLVIRIPRATAGYTVNFTANLTSPDYASEKRLVLGQNTTNSTGHAVYNLNPDTSLYAGNYTWWGESDVSYRNTTATFIIKGSVTVNRTHPALHPNATYNQSDTAAFWMNITSPKETQDELGGNYSLTVNATFKHNATGTPTYVPSLSYNGENWTGTQTIGLTDPVGNWSVVGNASGPYTYLSESPTYYTEVHGLSNLTLSDDTDTQTKRVYELVNFTANYTDTSDAPINRAGTTCRVRYNLTSGWTAYTDMTYDAATGLYYHNRTFTETYTGAVWNVHCDDSLYEAQNETSTYTINRTAADMHTPNGTTVDRDGVSADPNTLLLNASMPDAPAGETISFYTDLSSPSLGQTGAFLGQNTTDATGHAVLTWDPNTTIYAGNHTVYANSTYADRGNDSYAHVYGDTTTVFYSSTRDPDANYTQNETAVVTANATAPGPETPTDFNSSYALSYTAYFESENGQDNTALSYTGAVWNGTYNLLTLAGVGAWNVSANATANYHYDNATNRTFDVYGYMNVTNSTLSPTEVFVYGSATQTCTVRDQHTGVAVSGATVSFYRNGTLLGTNSTNTSGDAQLTFQTNSSGTYTVLCNVSDQPGIYYYAGDDNQNNDSLTVKPYPITPTSPANGTQVDRDSADAGVPDTVLLNVSVPSYVPDGTNITFEANLTSPFADGPTVLGQNQTVGGVALLRHDPNSSGFAGNHTWYGTSADGASNGSRIYTSLGGLQLAFRNDTFSPDENYTQNETAGFRFNLTSPGAETRSNLSSPYGGQVNFTVVSVNGEDANTTSFVDPYWDGSYDLLSLAGVGVWNVSGNSSADFFFGSDVTNRNFTVYGYMNVTSSALSPSTIEAYQSATQTCSVEDQHTGVAVSGATVSFYRNGTLLGTNSTNSSGDAQYTFSTSNTGTYTVLCNVSDQPGIYYLAGDDNQNNDSLTVNPYSITPVGPANGTQVDRDGVDAGVSDTILFNVSVPSYVPDGVDINFTGNTSSPLSQGPVLFGTNATSGGNALLRYDPATARRSGVWDWGGESAAGEKNGTRSFDLYGSLSLVFRNASFDPDSSYDQNETIAARFNLTGPGPESRTELADNYSGAVNFTVVSVNGQDTNGTSYVDPYWDGSYSLLSLAGVGVWNITGNSSADYSFYGDVNDRNFTVYGYMNVTDLTLENDPITVFENTTARCRVQDQHTGVAVSGVQVEYFLNATSQGNATTNSTGWAVKDVQVNNSGTHNITCDVDTQLSLYYKAGDGENRTGQVTANKYSLATTGPANGTVIDRDGVSTDADTATLTVQAQSTVPAGRTIEFRANLTSPGLGYTDQLLGTNTTNSTGGATLVYDPNSTTYAGDWTWWAQETEASPYNTSTLEIKGGLNVTFENATRDPDAEYNRTDSVRVNASLASRGPEAAAELNASYAAAVNTTLTDPLLTDTTFGLVFDATRWTNATTMGSNDAVGVWNVTLNSSASHFYYDDHNNRNYTLYSWMNVTDSTLSPTTIFVYGSATQTCTVRDHYNGSAVSGATVSFYRNGTLLGTNNTNSTGDASFTFQTNSTGTYTVLCNVTDELSSYYYAGPDDANNDTLTVDPYPITPTSPANGTQVDRDGVDAGVPDTVLLNVSVPSYVPDDTNITFQANLSAPFTTGAVVLGKNATSGGNALLRYDPNTTSYAGNHTWYGTSADGTSNGSRVYTEIGGLQLSFRNDSYDPDANYTQNETAEMRFNLTSPGPESRSNLSSPYSGAVNFTVVSVNGQDTNTTAYTSPYWSGSYDLLSLAGVGVWNVSGNSSADFFVFGDANDRNFTVYGYMNVTSSMLSPSTIEAYQTATQTCSVEDQHTSVAVTGATVSFYRNGTLLGTDSTNSSGDAQYTFATNNTGTYTVLCNVSDQPGIYYLAGDDNQNTETLTVDPYSITPVAPANGTQVDRDAADASMQDTILLNVSVPSYVPDGVDINFTGNATSPLTGSEVLFGTNATSGGYALLRYDPATARRSGVWTWGGESVAGERNGTRTYDLYGSLSLVFRNSSLNPDTEYDQNETLTARLNLTGPGPETRTELADNYSAQVNFTLYSTNGQDANATSYVNPYWDGSYDLLSLAGVGVWNITGNSSADYSFYNDANDRNFTVYGYMNVTNASLDSASVPIFSNATMRCRVQDQHTSVSVSGVQVAFYRNGTHVGNASTNSTGWAVRNFSTDTTGTYDVVCDVDDQLSLYYKAGDEENRSASLTVTPYSISAVSPANGTVVDRDSVSSDPDSVLLEAQADSTIPAGRNFTFRMNLTSPALGLTDQFLGKNQTNSTGGAVLRVDINSSTYAGNWTWFARDGSDGVPNQTRIVTVTGGLNVTFENVSYDPDDNYSKIDSARVNATLSSLGPESEAELNTSYAASVNSTLHPPSAAAKDVLLSYTGSLWTGTYAFLDTDELGVWNVSLNSSASYFYYDDHDDRNFTLYSNMNVTDLSLSDATVYAYESLTQSCSVRDQYNDSAVSGATVRFYRDSTLLGTNSTNTSGETTLTYNTSVPGSYTVYCNVTDQVGSIYYFAGSEPEQNASLTVDPYPITPTSPANGTLVDRDSADAGMPDTVLLNVSVPNFVPDGVNITFETNLTSPFVDGPTVLGQNATIGGNVLFRHDPNSTGFAGNHTWYGTAASGAANGSRTYLSYGALGLVFRNDTFSPDENYTQNETAGFRFNLTSPGAESRSNLSSPYGGQVNFTVVSVNGEDANATSFVDPYWDGSYDLLSLAGVGVWNVSGNSSADWFFGDDATGRNFTVYGFMNVTDSSLSPSTHTAYQSATQTCTVEDQHTSVAVSGATVSFYRDATLLGTNDTNSSGDAQLTFQTNSTGTYTVTCNVSDQTGIYYLAGDDNANNDTLTVNPYPITPVAPANGTQLDRDGVDAGVSDTILLNVSVPSYVADGVTINFTGNATSPLFSGPVLLGQNATSGGNALLRYDAATARRSGVWDWGGTSDAGYMNGTRTYDLYGSLSLVFRNASLNPDAEYDQNETATVRLNLTGPGPESRTELADNYSGQVNFTVSSTSGQDANTTAYTSPYWDGSYDLLSLAGVGVWNVSGNSSADYSFYGDATDRNFTVYGYMNVTNVTLTPTTVPIFEDTLAECRVQDQHTGAAVSGVQVAFYRNGTHLGNASTNSTGWANLTFNTSATGTYNVTCDVDTQLSLYYKAGDEENLTSVLTVEPYSISAVSPANGTVVDRDGVSADNDTVRLEAQADSTIPAGRNFTFRMNLTSPALGYSEQFLGKNQTNSSGAAVLFVDINSSTYAGNWTWFARDGSDGVPNRTKTLHVTGALNIMFENASYDPDDNYSKIDSARVNATLSSLGPESESELNTSYAASPNTTLHHPGGPDRNTDLSYTGSLWTGTYAFVASDAVGVWNVSLNSSASYFYYDDHDDRNFTLYSNMNVTDLSLSDATVYAYESLTQSCTVRDQYNDSAVSGATVSFYRDSTLLGTNTTNASGETTLTYNTSTPGSYTVYCNVTDQISTIYYAAGNEPEQNASLTVSPYPITPTSPSNDTLVDRDAANASMPDTILLNVSVPSYVPDGTNLTFETNLTDPFVDGPTVLGQNATIGGTALFRHDPNSTGFAGNHTWYGTEASGATNGSRTYLSYGALGLVFRNDTFSPDENYTQNETATVRFNLTSPGAESRSNLSSPYGGVVNFTVVSVNGEDANATGFVGPYWDGSYDLLSLTGVGVWNVSGNSSADFFFGDDATGRNFTVYGYMNVTASTLSPSTINAYQTSTQTCTVQDQHTNVAVSGATVSFYNDGVLLGTNATNSSGEAQYTFVENETGTHTILCNVSDQPGIYYYAGDDNANNDTLTVDPFPITPTSPANGTQVDRDAANASMPDTLLLNVSVPSYVPDGTNITFEGNATAPLFQGPVVFGQNATSGGNALLRYDPDSSTRAGSWTWMGSHASGVANGTRTFEEYGDLSLAFWSSDTYPDASYDQNETITSRFNLTTPGNASRTELADNYSAQANFTVYSTNGQNGNTTSYVSPYWEGDYALLSLAGVGVWNLTGNSSADYSFYGDVNDRNFTVYGYMNVTNTSLDKNPVPVFSNASVRCRVQDQHTGAAVSGVQVEYFLNSTSQGNATTNSTGWASKNFTVDRLGDHNVTCDVDTQLSLYYKAGDAPNRTVVLTVEPYTISAVSPANGTVVDRDGVSADNDTVRLEAQADSTIPSGRNFTFRMNLTSPALGYTDQLLGQNQTDGSGAAVLYVDINSSTYAGNWTWFAEDAGAGVPNQTRTLHVTGGLNVTFDNASYDPNATYNQTQTVRLNASVSSFGPETASELNASYALLVDGNLTPPTTAVQNASLSYVSPHWTGTHALSLFAEVGNWTASLNASDAYFYEVSENGRNFTVIGLSNLSLWDDSDSGVVRMFQNFTFYANYTDSANVSINYTDSLCRIRFNTTGSYGPYNNMSFSSGQDVWTYSTNFSDHGNFTFNVHCDDPLYVPQNETDGFVVNKTAINSLSPANGTIVDRDNTTGAYNDTVRLLANVDEAVAGITVNFTIWLQSPASGLQQGVIIGQNDTVAGGNVTLWWNPNGSVYAGVNEWGGEAENAEANRTLNVSVYGALSPVYENASYDPNASYNQSQTVVLRANVSTPGPENRAYLESWHGLVYNVTLSKPSGANDSRVLSRNASTGVYNASYDLSPTDEVGVWGTSTNLSTRYFFNDSVSLRGFTVYGLSNLSALDEQDLDGVGTWAGQDAVHYANWTDLDGAPISSGTCTLYLHDASNRSMVYDGGLWENTTAYSFEATARYTVNCSKPFYWNVSDTDNITIQSVVNLSALHTHENKSADGEWSVVLNVTNEQSYTEHGVNLYTVFPGSLSYTASPAAAQTRAVSGRYGVGEAVRWHFDNLSAGETGSVRVNVTGSGDWALEPLLGVNSSTVSGVVLG